MLEVKDLRKVYKTKNGSNVNALDGVTLQFPERGMIFLLGKSGSGKSTLLNVCGGLDSPTSGEVIVKGRSSKSFIVHFTETFCHKHHKHGTHHFANRLTDMVQCIVQEPYITLELLLEVFVELGIHLMRMLQQ